MKERSRSILGYFGLVVALYFCAACSQLDDSGRYSVSEDYYSDYAYTSHAPSLVTPQSTTPSDSSMRLTSNDEWYWY